MRTSQTIFMTILLAGAIAVAGCAPKNLKTEEISAGTEQTEKKTGETTPSQGENTIVVPDERPAQEQTVTSTELTPGATGSGPSASADARPDYASVPKEEQLSAVAAEKGQLFTVYFDYDNYSIRDNDAENLAKNARWLGLNQSVKVTIEGHADERGDEEYNLALGDKRAQSVKRYLNDLGISPARLDVLSYGEEKPAAIGHDEDAWSKNRRAEFVILK
ncbi:MAG: peptidoglycan-associated lipoprotein Pal [Deltaproteobacteria bacterium]